MYTDAHCNGHAKLSTVLSSTPKHRSLASSASWLMIAKTIGFVINTALPLVLANRLSLTEFGNYKQLFVLLNSAVMMLPLGMQMSAFYFIPRARDPEAKKGVVFAILFVHVAVGVLAALVLLAWPNLLKTLFKSPELASFGALIGLAMALWVNSTLLETLTVANGETRLSSIVIVVSNLSRSLLLLGAALIWVNLQSLIWAAAIYSGMQVIYLLFYLNFRFPGYWKAFRFDSLRALLSYSIPMGLAGLLWYLQLDLHNYFVSHQFGPAVFAIYAIGTFQLPLIGILGDSVASVVIPRVASLQQNGQRDEIVELAAKVMRSLAAVFLPIYAFLSVMAPEFITFLFKVRFLPSVPIFRVNLLMLPLSVMMIDPIMRAYSNQRYFLLWMHAVALALMLLVFWFGLPGIGLTGAMACVVATQYLTRFVELSRMIKVLDLRWHDLRKFKDLWSIGLAAGGGAFAAWAVSMAGGSHWLPFFSLLWTGVAFMAVYAGLLIAMRVPRPEEIEWLKRRFHLRADAAIAANSRAR
jgi:O-antigen/teichoic acid export membrane protein